MRKVFVPLDGSELAEAAIPLGMLMARNLGAEVELFHVLAPSSPFAPGSPRESRRLARAYLEQVIERASNGHNIGLHIGSGDPTAHSITLATLEPESMFAMSTHARAGLKRLALGSVADEMIRKVAVPVTLVRGNEATVQPDLRSILVPLDGSVHAEAVLPLVTELALRSSARVTLVHVIDPYREPLVGPAPGMDLEPGDLQLSGPPEFKTRRLTDARGNLENIAERLRSSGLRVDWEIRVGEPTSEILRASATIQSDLVAIATHGRGGYRRWVLGSVTTDIIQGGSVPVLVIPRGG